VFAAEAVIYLCIFNGAGWLIEAIGGTQLNQGSRGKPRYEAELSPARCERVPYTG